MRVSFARLLPLPAPLETKYHAEKAQVFQRKILKFSVGERYAELPFSKVYIKEVLLLQSVIRFKINVMDITNCV